MKTRRGQSDRGLTRKSRTLSRPSLERFEDRLLLSTFTVTNTSDTTSATADDGSLRGEILASNSTTSSLPNQIVFALPNGLQTISTVAPLPTIIEPVTIDGSTATGFTTQPLIQINGAQNVQGGAGFSVNSGGVVIQDLIIDGFKGDGIDLTGPGGDTIVGNYIGTDPTGTSVVPNTGVGILVASPNNLIGTSAAQPNVVSGNNVGIQITGNNASGNLVSNNYVGTNAAGTAKLGNANYGIEVNTGGTTGFFGNNTPGNTIGGITSGSSLNEGNLISGNLAGLAITGNSANQNLVEGNFIGTDITGLLPIPNTNDGIDLTGVNQTTIGGTTGNVGNVISGNGGNGILVSGSASTLNLIQGNDIGVGSDGGTAVGNSKSGVVINGANQNTIGGIDVSGSGVGYGNIIDNNGLSSANFYGVEILGGTGDAVLSNSIFGNGGPGIKLNQGNSGVKPPTITSSESGAGQTKITGTYSGSSNDTYFLQFFASATPNASGAGDGEILLGETSVTTDGSGNASFTALLPTAVPVGYAVSATATDSIFTLNNTSEFATNFQNIQAPVSNIQVSSTGLSMTTGMVSGASPSTPLFDQNFVYTITIANSGPNDDTNVILTDALPANATFISSSVGTAVAGVLTANVGTVPANGSVNVTVTIKPTQVGSITNTASITGDALLNPSSTTSFSQTDTVVPDSDLAVLITPASTTAAPIGSPLSYAVTVSNFGPSPASGVVTTFSLPSNFTNITVSADQGSYTIDGNNNVTILTGLLGVSSSSTIIITGTPNATGPALTTASVTAGTTTGGVTTPEADPDSSNNSVSNTVQVSYAADLGVTLDASPNPVLVGGELTYTAVLTNYGPSAAQSPQLLDVLPANLTFDPTNSTPGLTYSPSTRTITYNPGSLLPNAQDTILIATIPTTPGEITNTVSVGDPTQATELDIDTNYSNNTASFTTQVSPADLSVEILNPNDPLIIGTQAVYQILVSNAGSADATDVLLNDTFSSIGSIISSSVGTFSGGTLNADLGPIASGGSTIVTITVNPTASGTLTDTATVSLSSDSPEYDPNTNNNSTSSTNQVSPANIAVSVTPSATTVLTGQPLTYTITVTNDGPATATNVLFNDTLPTGVTIQSYLTSQGALGSSATAIAGNLGTLASGASATITIVVIPTTIETAINTTTVSSDNVNSSGNFTPVVTSTSVNVINLPGSLQFGSSVELVPENAGTITLTVSRSGGTLGAVTVDYATSDFTAIAGVNYVASTGTISFADGQTTATITIAVLDDGIINDSHGFFVTLSNPTNGASVGTPASIGVVVTNTDRDTIPPVVSSLIAIPNGSAIDGFVVTFDKAMDFDRVTLLSNYHLFVVNANGTQSVVPLAGLEYDLTNHAVTIVPTAPLASNKFYHIIVNGSYGPALTDTSGNILFGSSGLGTNYDVYYGQGNNVTYNDALGNRVNIKLTGGGTLGVFLASNGNASAINLYGIVPHKSKLSGSVTKLSKQASGYTIIGSIDGFGQFGNVYSTLTTPAFYVGSAPVSSSAAKSVSLKSVPSKTTVVKTTVTTKSATPKGPKVKLA